MVRWPHKRPSAKERTQTERGGARRLTASPSIGMNKKRNLRLTTRGPSRHTGGRDAALGVLATYASVCWKT